MECLIVLMQFTFCNLSFFRDQMQLHHSDNFAVLLITSIQTFYSFGLIYTACELCQRANFAFEDCIVSINQFEWYSFPDEIQRLLPLIIQFTQQPIELKCYGSTACDRELFKYVSICWARSDHVNRSAIHSKWFIYYTFTGNQNCIFVFYDSS